MKFSEFVDVVNKIKTLHCRNIKLYQYQAAEMLEGYTVSKVSYDFIWKLEWNFMKSLLTYLITQKFEVEAISLSILNRFQQTKAQILSWIV